MIKQVKPVLRAVLNTLSRYRNRGYARGARRSGAPLGLEPEAMVLAYAQGLFPLGRPGGQIDWETLPQRGVIAADEVHVSKRLKTYLRKNTFEVRYNQRFDEVLAGCADREETWINEPLHEAYYRLNVAGIAHSVEAYQEGELVGGGFGLAIGRVFFLDSMYCTVDHASKIAFVRLAERLVESGFQWIDCQYLSEHWKRFGAKPVARAELVKRVVGSLDCGARFRAEESKPTETPSATPLSLYTPADAVMPVVGSLS